MMGPVMESAPFLLQLRIPAVRVVWLWLLRRQREQLPDARGVPGYVRFSHGGRYPYRLIVGADRYDARTRSGGYGRRSTASGYVISFN